MNKRIGEVKIKKDLNKYFSYEKNHKTIIGVYLKNVEIFGFKFSLLLSLLLYEFRTSLLKTDSLAMTKIEEKLKERLTL